MDLLNRLLPVTANNQYHGHKIAYYFFPVVITVYTVRSLIHFLKDDSGTHAIASIIRFSGSPDPNTIMYLFSSLWGSQQLISVAIMAIVFWRYKSMISFFYLLLVIEIMLRFVSGNLHPLTPEYYQRVPPGSVGQWPSLIVFSIMLGLSLPRPNVVKT